MPIFEGDLGVLYSPFVEFFEDLHNLEAFGGWTFHLENVFFPHIWRRPTPLGYFTFDIVHMS
jgi:hypothetical protein